MGINPRQYLMLIPAQPPTVRHLEGPWDQVRIFLIGCAGTDGRCRFANQGRQLFDEKNFGQAVRAGQRVHCLHACLTSERACESRCCWLRRIKQLCLPDDLSPHLTVLSSLGLDE
jgi:hypothetical protein